MIDPSQIKEKANRKYKYFLQAIISNQNFFPLELPIGKIPRDYIQLRDELAQLIEGSRSQIGCGYTVELATKNTRRYGNQSLPTRISIDTQDDYLKVINKQSEFTKLKADIELIRSFVPQLEEWSQQYPLQIVKHSDKWSDLLKVCRYFQSNHHPNLYIRELPIEVHTKFIEENNSIITSLLEAILPSEAIQTVARKKNHVFEQKFSLRYEEPLVRLRILDRQIKEKYCFPVCDLTTPLSEFEQINLEHHFCLITENKMNFLTLPNLPNSIAIWGGGYRTTMLKSVIWLSNCHIFYWGDIDADGFKILSQFRGYFPQTVSVMMDRNSFEAFKQFAVNTKQSEPENLSNLSAEEYSLYSLVSKQGKRLEQEHISQGFAVEHLTKCLAKFNTRKN